MTAQAPPASNRRIAGWINLGLFLAGVVTLALVANFFAGRPGLRISLDATKTRAYSLSEQTTRLLAQLKGEWTIAVIVDETQTDRAALRQLDEVLRRYEEASPRISITRIDPTDPRSLRDYEALLSRLQTIYRSLVDEYDEKLDDGMKTVADFQLFVQQQQSRLDRVLKSLAADDLSQLQVEQLLLLFEVRAEQGEQVVIAVKNALRTTNDQPIPDYETARSILDQALTQWGEDLNDIARVYERWLGQEALSAEVTAFAASTGGEYDELAEALLIAADPLLRLPPLELAAIGRQLRQAQLAVVIGPQGATVIPSNQLFPTVNMRRTQGGISFDQRFRGEQVISAAIRSLRVEHMPMVVFVHADDGSMLRSRDRQVDLLGAAAALQASRFDVREWTIGSTDRPRPAVGQTAVWLVIPPPHGRRGLNPSAGESMLIDRTFELIEDGEPVMVNLYPSLLPRYGHTDPWQRLAATLGVDVDTSRVIVEEQLTLDGDTERQRGQYVQEFPQSHPIARVVHGHATFFPLPLSLRPHPSLSDMAAYQVIAEVKPRPNRWLEADWSLDPEQLDEPKPEQRFSQALAIAIAVTRPHPVEAGRQRFMVIGSGGWMLTYVADVVFSVGGDRIALAHPGNHELLAASVAWLAGMDELVAPSPLSQEIARLDGITSTVRTVWGWCITVLAPLGCLAAGMVVWLTRRT